MTHVVTEKCIKCKYTTCVEVCPVDCFYEHELMVVIDPDECIDCGVCVPECPIDAIKPDSEVSTKEMNFNRDFAKKCTPIDIQKEPLPNAKSYINETNKFEKYVK